MFDKIRDAFGEFSERVRSPFFSSYIISWLIYNWRIALFVLWPKSKYPATFDMSAEYIEKQLAGHDWFLVPLFAAIGYTLIQPVLRVAIAGIHAWINRWGITWVFSLSQNSSISFKRYMKLKNAFIEKERELEKAFKEEIELNAKVAESERNRANVNLELQKNLNLLQKAEAKITDLQFKYSEINDISRLEGHYVLKYQDEVNPKLNGIELLEIKNENYYIFDVTEQEIIEILKQLKPLSEVIKKKKRLAFKLEDYCYSKEKMVIFFNKVNLALMDDNFKIDLKRKLMNKYNINCLSTADSGVLIGYENSTTKVEYTKVL